MGEIAVHHSRSTTILVLALLWLAAAAASGAGAAALYKCVDGRGQVSYQSQACADGAEQAWVREATPQGLEAEAPAPAPPPVAEPVGGASDVRIVIRPGGRRPEAGGSPPVRKAASVACRRAQAADAAYRAQPLGRVKHDGLRRHGDRILAACG